MNTTSLASADHAAPDLYLDVSRHCGDAPSFGAVLTALLQARGLSQKQFAALIFRSEADVSRLINDRLPQNFHLDDLHQIRTQLNCAPVEFAQLTCAFICNLLAAHGLVDPDIDP